MSSCNDCIKFSLNIKDPLLEFLDISTGKYRNREAKFYPARPLLKLRLSNFCSWMLAPNDQVKTSPTAEWRTIDNAVKTITE